MPRIDGDDDRILIVGAEIRRGISGQRRHADHGNVGRDAEAARGGNADPQAGEAAGAGRHHDAVEIGKGQPDVLHDPRNERHQRFGMAADHRQAFARDDAAIAPVSSTAAEQAASAVSMASTRMKQVDIDADCRRAQNAGGRRLHDPRHMGRTSVTSGMK